MNYMPVEAYGEWTSAERADLINEELFNLSRPVVVKDEKDVTTKLFGEITHPTTGQVALQVDMDYKIRIHSDKDISNLQNLFANLQQEELDALSAYLDSNSVIRFGDIVPSTSDVLTEEEARAAGWFPVEEI